MGSVRKQIMELIEKEPRTAKELSKMVGVREKEVYRNLSHVKKSVKASGKQLKIKAYECHCCGFRFKDRKHFHPPSRCPVCKEERISTAVFEIK